MKRILFALFSLMFSALSHSQNNYIKDPTGVYQYEGGAIERNGDTYGYTGQVEVLLIAPKKIIVNLYINKGAPSYNSGQMTDSLEYNNNTAVWLDSTMSPCKLIFHFSRRQLYIEMFADNPNFACGFGHAVDAQGSYLKMKRKRPTIDEMLSAIEDN